MGRWQRGEAGTVAWVTLGTVIGLQTSGHYDLSSSSFAHAAFVSLPALPLFAFAWHLRFRKTLMWQMLPLLPVLALFVAQVSLTSGSVFPMGSYWLLSLLICAPLMTLFALYLFPLFDFPQRTGDCTVLGFSSFVYSRQEDEEEDDAQHTTVQRAYFCWYPCDANASGPHKDTVKHMLEHTSHQKQPKRELPGPFPYARKQASLLLNSVGWSRRLISTFAPAFSHLSHLRFNVKRGYPLHTLSNNNSKVKPKYPVIIFSHGLYGFPSLYTHICAELASFGFIVVSIGHTDGSGYVLSPFSGEIVNTFLPATPGAPNCGWDMRNNQLTQRVRDITVGLDRLEIWNKDPHSLFYDALDLSRTVLVGHSFGGCSCVAAVLYGEQRVKLAISLDGWFFPLPGSSDLKFRQTLPKTAFRDPSADILLIQAEVWDSAQPSVREANLRAASLLCEMSELDQSKDDRKTRGRWMQVQVRGTGHHSFHDMGFWFPAIAKRMGLVPTAERASMDHTYAGLSALIVDWIRAHWRSKPADYAIPDHILHKHPEIIVL